MMNLAEEDPEQKSRTEAFLQGLQQLGWTGRQNVEIEISMGYGRFYPRSSLRAGIGCPCTARYSQSGFWPIIQLNLEDARWPLNYITSGALFAPFDAEWHWRKRVSNGPAATSICSISTRWSPDISPSIPTGWCRRWYIMVRRFENPQSSMNTSRPHSKAQSSYLLTPSNRQGCASSCVSAKTGSTRS